jgi:hypothetical protein
MGFFRWRIIIPAQADRQLKREHLRAMLAHELAHLVRRDPFWQWLGRLLCSIAAFQPLNRIAWKRWRCAAEFQCDAWAVQSGVTRLALARCLTSIAEWRHVQPVPQPVLASSAGSGDLSERVERLLDRKPLPPTPSRGGKAKRLACVAALLGLFCVALPHVESKGEIVDVDLAVQPEHSLPAENPCTFADPASGMQVVLREIRNLDQEISALRIAAHALQDHPSTSETLDSQRFPEHVLTRLETIERLRNDLAQLSARLANERTEK